MSKGHLLSREAGVFSVCVKENQKVEVCKARVIIKKGGQRMKRQRMKRQRLLKKITLYTRDTQGSDTDAEGRDSRGRRDVQDRCLVGVETRDV